MFSAIDRFHYTRIRLVLNIDDAVSKITPTEVHHINDVKVVVGQHSQYVAQHFGHIFIAKSNQIW